MKIKYEINTRGHLLCTNIKEVLYFLRIYHSLSEKDIARAADCDQSTIRKWKKNGYASKKLVENLCKKYSLLSESERAKVLLNDATPRQLKERCQQLGWDVVINA